MPQGGRQMLIDCDADGIKGESLHLMRVVQRTDESYPEPAKYSGVLSVQLGKHAGIDSTQFFFSEFPLQPAVVSESVIEPFLP